MRTGPHRLLFLFSIILSPSFAVSSSFVAESQPSSYVDDHVHREVQSSSEFGNTVLEMTDDSIIKGFDTMEPVIPTPPLGDENSTMITGNNNTNSTDPLLGNVTSPITNGTDFNVTSPITNGTDFNVTSPITNGTDFNGTYPIINGTDIYNNSTNSTQNSTVTDPNDNSTIINNGTHPINNGTDIYNNSTNSTQNSTVTDPNDNSTIINNGTYPINNGTDIYNNSTNSTRNNNQTDSGGNITFAPSIMPTSLLPNNNTNQTTNITSFPSLTPTYGSHSNHPSMTPTFNSTYDRAKWTPPTYYPTIREPKHNPPHSVIYHPTHKPWQHRPVPTAAPNFDEKLKDEIKEEKEEIEKVAKDPTAEILAAVLITFAILGMLTVAYQVLENPDGLCASFCRLCLKCALCCFKIFCLPCRFLCGGRNQTEGYDTSLADRGRRIHHDLELA